MFDSDLGPAPRRGFTELPGCLGRVKVGFFSNELNMNRSRFCIAKVIQITQWTWFMNRSFMKGHCCHLYETDQTVETVVSFILTYFRLCVCACLPAVEYSLFNKHLSLCCLAYPSSPPLPPLSLSFPRGCRLISLNSTTAALSVLSCVYMHVYPCQRSLRRSWVKGVKKRLSGSEEAPQADIPSWSRRFSYIGYCESAINLHPALLPFPYSSWLSRHPPHHHTSLIGVIVAPPQSNDRERESCVTPPHQTINQAYWEAHPKPCDPHATQTVSTLYSLCILNECI